MGLNIWQGLNHVLVLALLLDILNSLLDFLDLLCRLLAPLKGSLVLLNRNSHLLWTGARLLIDLHGLVLILLLLFNLLSLPKVDEKRFASTLLLNNFVKLLVGRATFGCFYRW